jgi:hypothetical protein
MFSSGENSYLFYGVTNALTDFNELVDEAREGHNCCGYGQGVHISSAVAADESERPVIRLGASEAQLHQK